MTAFLPQHESFAGGELRRLRLDLDRGLYQYDYTHVSPLAVLKELPIVSEFSFRWLEAVGKKVLEALANRSELEVGALEKELPKDKKRMRLYHHMVAADV